MMKRIIGVIVLILVAVGGYFGYRYWADTYQSTKAYAVVQQQVPEKTKAKDDDGKLATDGHGRQLYQYEYHFDWVTTSGKKISNTFYLLGVNPTPLKPGSYVTGEVSNKRVNQGPNAVNKSDVPKDVLAKLN